MASKFTQSDDFGNITGFLIDPGAGIVSGATSGTPTSTTYLTYTGATSGSNGADQINVGSRGIKVFVNITTLTAGSITVTVQGKDAVSGVYYTILASAAISATGFNVLTVYPGLTAVANVTATDVMPRSFRIITAIVTGPCTATINYNLIP